MGTDINQIAQKVVDNLSEKTPELVKKNKGALIGAVIGYLLTDNEKAKSALLGAVAGSLIGDKKDGE